MDKPKHKLQLLRIKGFKSIGKEQKITFGDINVMIGANGVGKSNLVSFFQLLNYLTTDKLQFGIGKQGYADSLLYYGSQKTESFSATLKFEDNLWVDEYSFALTYAYRGQMMFAYETIYHKPKDKIAMAKEIKKDLGSGHKESLLQGKAQDVEVKIILTLLSKCRIYQFHNTSETAYIRQPCSINDNRYLKSDAGNLAAYLYEMKYREIDRDYYQRIIDSIQNIMPQFQDFFLEPLKANFNLILLQWTAKNHDNIFGVHQISDGSLRFMALATLLLQPPWNLPNLIIIDEPELGLHPEALVDLAGMIKIAAQNCQIILSTQSAYLLNFFEVKDIIVVSSKNDTTVFEHLDEKKLAIWLNDYTMAEIWDKNLIGGRP